MYTSTQVHKNATAVWMSGLALLAINSSFATIRWNRSARSSGSGGLDSSMVNRWSAAGVVNVFPPMRKESNNYTHECKLYKYGNAGVCWEVWRVFGRLSRTPASTTSSSRVLGGIRIHSRRRIICILSYVTSVLFVRGEIISDITI